jgi:hypothetical protein
LKQSATVEANETSIKITPATTKWEVFEKAGLRPVEIVCNQYKPFHLSDNSCHSRVLPKFDNLMTHLDGDHGGGFYIKFEKSDGKPWAGWKELKANGVELYDIRCDHCGQVLPLNGQILQSHLFKMHRGERAKSIINQILRFTLSKNAPAKDEDADFLDE